MIDQEKLREAIRHVRAAIPWQYQMVADAAESTLPKGSTVWDLTASARSHAPYESQRVIFEAAKLGGCIEGLYAEGFHRVVVTAREVAA